ncbi:MAG: sulfur oxidation c-type cytochrome SoxA, partial [Sulfurovum sp. 16-42-52]
MKRVILPLALLVTMGTVTVSSSEQFAMSDADRAMYNEMLENNPADIYVEEGGELLEETLGGEAALAKFLGVSEDELPRYIAGFPRYIEKLGNVVGIDQVMQVMQLEQGKEKWELKDERMFSMLAYVKSLANGEQLNIDIHADEHMKEAYALGKVTYETPRGGRGLSCKSCHGADVAGQILRT